MNNRLLAINDTFIRDTWIPALRSGNFRQGRAHLKIQLTGEGNAPQYCCLGVACELISENPPPGVSVDWQPEARMAEQVTVWKTHDRANLWTDAEQLFVGVSSPMGKLPGGYSLTDLNDHDKRTFPEIAAYLDGYTTIVKAVREGTTVFDLATFNLGVLARWATELLSGRYLQGRAHLRENDRYCCLGVLCETVGLSGADTLKGIFEYEGFSASLPPSVGDRVGGWPADPDDDYLLGHLPYPAFGGGYMSLASANDAGVPFAEIGLFLQGMAHALDVHQTFLAGGHA